MRLKRTTSAIATAMLLAMTTTALAADTASPYARIRAELRREPVVSRLVVSRLPSPVVTRSRQAPKRSRPSLWKGAAIGGAIGALIGGALWGPSLCSANDPECTAITVPVGIAAGGGIGAAAGAITVALLR